MKDQKLHPSCRWFRRDGATAAVVVRRASQLRSDTWRLRLRGSLSDRRLAVVAALALLTLFTLAMLAARMAYTGTHGHSWLAWNLFLAWIPFALALLLYERARAGALLRVIVPLGLLWLVFFPNAPYLVTDLKYVGGGGRIPVLYDVLLFSAGAWTGCYSG